MRLWLMVFGSWLLLIGGATSSDVRFADVTKASGVSFTHRNSATSNKYLVETMGGGVALLDYDNDGRLDIFLTNGAKIEDPMPPGKLPDKSDPAYWNRLYHQNADGTFVDVTEKAHLTGMPQNRYGMGIAVGDYDNDGFDDLYVTNYGGNTLYHNDGNGTFTDVTGRAGVGASGWSASAGFFDYDNDGRLDLLVTRYVDWTFQNNRHCGETQPGYRSYCHPDNFEGMTNLLFHNNGDGTFTDVSEKSGIARSIGKGLGVSFADYDNDGFTDVYVANDSVQCFLFHNNGDGTFSEVGLTAGVGFNEDGKTFAGMGVDFADYDNDGRPDIVVTDLSNERYMLFRQNADHSFREVTNLSGLGAATLSFSGWSTRLFDYDNDGWKDLFVAQGHVMDTIEKTAPNLRYLQPPLLLRNDGGRFVRVDAGDVFQRSWAGRGAAFGDLDKLTAELEAFRKGRAFLLKDRIHDLDQLVATIKAVARGECRLDARLIDELLERRSRRPRSPLENLTPRQRDILADVAAGKSNLAIATERNVTQRAVEKHVSEIFGRLGLATDETSSRRVQATLLYLAQRKA